jgi:hypothetical protein
MHMTVRIVMVVRVVMVVMTFVVVIVLMAFMVMMIRMIGVCRMMFGIVGVDVISFAVLVVMRLRGLRRIGSRMLDDLALHPFAIAAAALIARPRTAAVGAVFGFFFGLAMGALVRLDQRLTVGDRDLIIVGVDFAEGQEAVAVAAVFDEGRLQRRLYPRDLGEIDVAAQLLALGGFKIKFFDAIAAHHNDPGLFRVGGIDQHFVGHFGTLDGRGRA